MSRCSRCHRPVDAAVWADYSHQVFALDDDAGEPLTGSADVVTFGVSLGL